MKETYHSNLSFNPQLQVLYLNGNIHLKIDGNRLLKALQPCRYTLRMLAARNCGLKGELSNSLFNFRQVMYIDLSYNNLTRHLAVLHRADAYNIVYLFYLAVKSNVFSGGLPVSFFTPLKSLTYLDVWQNLFLRSEYTFLNIYIEATYRVKIQKDTFSCPTIRLSSLGGRIEMDSVYSIQFKVVSIVLLLSFVSLATVYFFPLLVWQHAV